MKLLLNGMPRGGEEQRQLCTYPTDYVVMVGQMGFARFAPVDLAAI